jgi:hypothetical protein
VVRKEEKVRKGAQVEADERRKDCGSRDLGPVRSRGVMREFGGARAEQLLGVSKKKSNKSPGSSTHPPSTVSFADVLFEQLLFSNQPLAQRVLPCRIHDGR